jgi:hypothetical protein
MPAGKIEGGRPLHTLRSSQVNGELMVIFKQALNVLGRSVQNVDDDS